MAGDKKRDSPSGNRLAKGDFNFPIRAKRISCPLVWETGRPTFCERCSEWYNISMLDLEDLSSLFIGNYYFGIYPIICIFQKCFRFEN